ncbi:(R,R)-butanediol dehydrogenase / meso-butanediol dehydrogenase / diacetyl reductase [Actinobaculum suis]|uniref:(R,R)-butanediol dehydrogenase / meso-butanediol dehydrogenase / diacetyl reductase n=1 Tax=Actinobaculum suis TaxID=1657 RepID=A0A1G7D3I0_9ACTO|nr:2,3-butanediol dehydrogenase [Actinobaculum suis]MDY5152819.1 2,3-butanediol dehydrogenase [Actinobaculum suis]SDE45285.1 (R,R)-butanediol dehydrogenase / meso-butanediol dehydrogenase / diacetyl reductase [Actinobaculum suis]
MKAVRYYGKEDVRLEEVPAPELLPGTVRIAPAYNGICGSDVHLYYDGVIPPAPTATEPHPISGETLPVIFGHEFSGVVEEVADDVEGFAPGDSVCVEPLMVCAKCPACQKGAYNLCVDMGFIGISGRGGGLAEQIVVEQRFVHKVGDIPLDQAALLEPLAVSVHAVRHAGIHGKEEGAGKLAVVGGAGPIGLLTAAVLKAYGVRTIVSEPAQARREMALSTGFADVAVDPTTEDLTEIVRQESEGAMAEYAFDAAGGTTVMNQLFAVLGAAGHLEVVALHMHPYELDITAALTMQDRTLGSCIGYANDHPEAIRLIADGEIDVAPLITSKITADRIVEDGLSKLKDPSEVKILVSMN